VLEPGESRLNYMNDEHICIDCNEKFFHDHDTMDMIYHKIDPIKYPLSLSCEDCDFFNSMPPMSGLPPIVLGLPIRDTSNDEPVDF